MSSIIFSGCHQVSYLFICLVESLSVGSDFREKMVLLAMALQAALVSRCVLTAISNIVHTTLLFC